MMDHLTLDVSQGKNAYDEGKIAALGKADAVQYIDELLKKVSDLKDTLDADADDIAALEKDIAGLKKAVAGDVESSIKELIKDILDIRGQLEAAIAKATKKPPKKSDNKVGARKSCTFKAICTAPSINKTPMGGATPPIPYPTTQDLSNSAGVVSTVRFNGAPVYVLGQSTQPSCKGDDAGTAGGVKSGTVNGEVKPVKGSTKVKLGGKPAMRDGDPCTMNGGNNPGIYTTEPAPCCCVQNGKPTGDTDPPIPAELQDLAKSVDQNWEMTKRVYKVIFNLASDSASLGAKSAALQNKQKSEAATMSDLARQTKAAEQSIQAAQQGSQGSHAIKLPDYQKPKFASDEIAAGVTNVLDLGKRAADVKNQVAMGIAEGSKLLESAKKALEGEKCDDCGGDGLKVNKK